MTGTVICRCYFFYPLPLSVFLLRLDVAPLLLLLALMPWSTKPFPAASDDFLFVSSFRLFPAFDFLLPSSSLPMKSSIATPAAPAPAALVCCFKVPAPREDDPWAAAAAAAAACSCCCCAAAAAAAACCCGCCCEAGCDDEPSGIPESFVSMASSFLLTFRPPPLVSFESPLRLVKLNRLLLSAGTCREFDEAVPAKADDDALALCLADICTRKPNTLGT